jgi:predicted enzyme related to lactoylglutathione lyase
MHDDMHFALVVDDFDATMRRLADAGAEWKEQPDLFGGRRGSTRDPLGNRIELLERAGRLV